MSVFVEGLAVEVGVGLLGAKEQESDLVIVLMLASHRLL